MYYPRTDIMHWAVATSGRVASTTDNLVDDLHLGDNFENVG